VSQWNDKSGNNRHCSQSTAESRPSYVANGLNGKSILRFDSDFLSSSYTNPTSGFSIFDVVARESSLGSGAQGVIFGYQTSTNRLFAGFRSNTALWHGFGIESTDAVSFNSAAGSYLLEISVSTSSRSVLRVNTATVSDRAYSGTSGGAVHQVGRGGGTGPVEGIISIAERVMVSSVITTESRQKIEGYLAHKWGLTANLPNDHPYKINAPAP
jgi:hypothetical protein